MTYSKAALERNIAELGDALVAGGRLLTALFNLAFFFPMLALVFGAETLIAAHAWLSCVPRHIWPTPAAQEEPAKGTD